MSSNTSRKFQVRDRVRPLKYKNNSRYDVVGIVTDAYQAWRGDKKNISVDLPMGTSIMRDAFDEDELELIERPSQAQIDLEEAETVAKFEKEQGVPESSAIVQCIEEYIRSSEEHGSDHDDIGDRARVQLKMFKDTIVQLNDDVEDARRQDYRMDG